MKREKKERLTLKDLRALGTSPHLVVRRVPRSPPLEAGSLARKTKTTDKKERGGG